MEARGHEVSVDPVRTSVTVKRTAEDAFRIFTEGFDGWWPLATHSVGGERAVECTFEPREGGRLSEIRDDGESFDWGTVRVWEPPTRVVFTWHPGRGPEAAQEVEVRFVASGRETRVELEHRNWDVLGHEARELRDKYQGGWEIVLGKHYADGCRG